LKIQKNYSERAVVLHQPALHIKRGLPVQLVQFAARSSDRALLLLFQRVRTGASDGKHRTISGRVWWNVRLAVLRRGHAEERRRLADEKVAGREGDSLLVAQADEP
jgi:hypothetical protein